VKGIAINIDPATEIFLLILASPASTSTPEVDRRKLVLFPLILAVEPCATRVKQHLKLELDFSSSFC
jgi:hypothetical protein